MQPIFYRFYNYNIKVEFAIMNTNSIIIKPKAILVIVFIKNDNINKIPNKVKLY